MRLGASPLRPFHKTLRTGAVQRKLNDLDQLTTSDPLRSRICTSVQSMDMKSLTWLGAGVRARFTCETNRFSANGRKVWPIQ
jgi:hypothetical protein